MEISGLSKHRNWEGDLSQVRLIQEEIAFTSRAQLLINSREGISSLKTSPELQIVLKRTLPNLFY